MAVLIAAAVASVSAFFLIRLFAPVAISAGLVDRPGGRKTHRQPVPLVGGLAILVSAQLGVLLLPFSLGEYRGLFAGAMLMLVIGFLDDFRRLPPTARLIAEIGALLVAISLGGPLLRSFGHLLAEFDLSLGWLSLPITLFCAVGVINALNMADGADGLAGTAFLITAGALLVLAVLRDAEAAAGILAVLAGSVFGFLLLNAPWQRDRTASVFMGDAGTLALGFLMAWFLIGHSQGQQRLFAPATALWLFAVPLWDTVFVMIRRIGQGRSPFAAGRDHIHHLFLRSGFPVRVTWAIYATLALSCATLGVVSELSGLPEYVLFYGYIAASTAYYLIVKNAWTTRTWLGRAVG